MPDVWIYGVAAVRGVQYRTTGHWQHEDSVTEVGLETMEVDSIFTIDPS